LTKSGGQNQRQQLGFVTHFRQGDDADRDKKCLHESMVTACVRCP
jgi:hypothetical protein